MPMLLTEFTALDFLLSDCEFRVRREPPAPSPLRSQVRAILDGVSREALDAAIAARAKAEAHLVNAAEVASAAEAAVEAATEPAAFSKARDEADFMRNRQRQLIVTAAAARKAVHLAEGAYVAARRAAAAEVRALVLDAAQKTFPEIRNHLESAVRLRAAWSALNDATQRLSTLAGNIDTPLQIAEI